MQNTQKNLKMLHISMVFANAYISHKDAIQRAWRHNTEKQNYIIYQTKVKLNKENTVHIMLVLHHY